MRGTGVTLFAPDSYRDAAPIKLVPHDARFVLTLISPGQYFQVRSGQDRVTCHLCRQAPRYPDIACRDLTLGPLDCRAVSCMAGHHDAEKKATNHRTYCGYYF